MLSQKIRREFLEYFKKKGHTIVPSSPVVPHADPTLLFTNAGMNQFKDVFLGRNKRDYVRATSSQKCIRVGGKHNDLDNVGHTSRHLTFFEMLGNFSFGDYFKEKAIEYAWEVTTQIFQFPPDLIWITVFEDDDEALSLWKKYVPEKRIVRMGEKENFWAMGDVGPCGPCSELLYDKGSKYGKASSPLEDASGERFFEFWNLVFMQFNRDQTGKLHSLPNKSIDTGAGLERVISLKMGVDNVFYTDILRHLISAVEKVSQKKYNPNDSHTASAFHVIADHLRSLAFAIADGAQPSNVERGYVLRKLLRRAVRYGRSLGLQEPFLSKLVPALIEVMGADYRELIEAKDRIVEVLHLEEENFIRTLKKGGNILNQIIEKALKNPLKQISGEEAFKLKDTYGFPIEEILLIAKDTGLEVNIDSYQLLEEQAKEKSRSAQVSVVQETKEDLFKEFVQTHGSSQFVGYSDLEIESQIVAIIKNGQFVDAISEGEEGILLLDKTPFYAEKGGQVADFGTITHDKARFVVQDCQSPYPGAIAHIGIMDHGYFKIGEDVFCRIDEARRQSIANHHTATHLLHWALQKVLGEHIRQAGSLVEENRLRFDFNHHKALSQEEIDKIEDLVNAKIRENHSVKAYELPYEEVQFNKEIKQFFGEKYGALVRVIDIDFSKELCGGTHTHHVGTIGFFRIAKESSIAAGVRRIEAVVGKAAEEFARSQEKLGVHAASLLKVPFAKLPEKVSDILEENTQLKSEIRSLKRHRLQQLAKELVSHMEKIHDISIVTQIVPVEFDELPLLAEEILGLRSSAIVVLAAQNPERCQLLVKVSPDLIQRGIHANSLIKATAPLIEGGGGGKADSAQAGGKKASGLRSAFETIKDLVHQSSDARK